MPPCLCNVGGQLEAILWLILGAVISSYGTRHSVLIPHGAQVTANLPYNLQPGFLLGYVLFCFYPQPQGKIYSQLGGVGGFCQDWTCRGGTGIETRGLQAKSAELYALRG